MRERNSMEITCHTQGVYVVAPTPFTTTGAIDDRSAGRMVEYFLKSGASGITVLGQMGEAAKLEQKEAVDFACRVIKRAGIPVVVGISAPGLAAMKDLARQVMAAGAAGVMVAPSPALRTDDQIVDYFAMVTAAIGADVPLVIQDYPLVFTVVMTPDVIRRIVTANPSCVMLKHEEWPGLEKISTLRAFEREGSMRHISILCGNGGLFLDFEMERGADGAMTGYCFPEVLVDLVNLFGDGKTDEAHQLFERHLPLIRYEHQPGVGLAVRKYVLMRRGIIESDAQRMPGSTLTPAGRTDVDYLLSRVLES
jgi:4-hydroxy-tetrahydrodipicolinate synthase